MLEDKGLLKLVMLSGDDLALSSWCISLASKLAVYERMELVADMSTNVKREMRPNTFGMPFYFLSLY